MTSRQRVALALLALVLVLCTWIVCVGKDAIQWMRMGDSALFEQLLTNILTGHGAVSNVFANTQSFIDHHYIGTPDTELLAREMHGALVHPSADERSMFGFHAYFVLYPLSLLLWLLPASMILVVVQTVSYALLAWCATVFVVQRTRNISLGLLFCALVLLSPHLFLGLLGQFYPDRLFVPLGFLLLWALHERKAFWLVLLISLILAITNERAASIGGALVGMHAVLFCLGRDQRRRLACLLMLAVAMLGYAMVIHKFVLTNLYYSTYMPQNLDDLVYRYVNVPGFATNLAINLQNNAFLLLLALFAPRYMLMALVVLTPNLIGSIGGAEKIGWSSHYHSYYFPVLCFAAAVGLYNLHRRFHAGRGRILFMFSFAGLVVACLLAQQVGVLNRGSSPSYVVREYFHMFKAQRRGEKTGYALRKEVEAAVAPGALVSTNEQGMAMLHEKARVAVYPLRLEEADYIYVACAELDKPMPATAQEYAGRSVAQTLSERYRFRFRDLGSPLLGACLGTKEK